MYLVREKKMNEKQVLEILKGSHNEDGENKCSLLQKGEDQEVMGYFLHGDIYIIFILTNVD